MKSKPPGYWQTVFARAAILQNQGLQMSGEEAYWIARRQVDAALQQLQLPGLRVSEAEVNHGS